jgi:hypothetical protein
LCERFCQRAEVGIIEERLSLRGRRDDDEPSVVNTHYFVEALRMTVSPEIHPSARGIIGEQLEEMRIALVTGDSDPVVSLVGKIRRRVPDELCWEAKKSTSVRDFEEASRLRRVAAKWAVAPNYAQALAIGTDGVYRGRASPPPRLDGRLCCCRQSVSSSSTPSRPTTMVSCCNPELVFGVPKKSGKTGFAALHMLTTILLFGGAFGEGYALRKLG